MSNGFEGLAEYTPDIQHEFHEQPAFVQLKEAFPALADDDHRQAFRAYVEKMWAAPESYTDFYRAYMEFLTPSEKSLKFKRLAEYVKQNSGRRRSKRRRRSRRPRRSGSSSKSGESKSGEKQSSNNSGKSSNRSGNRRSNNRSRRSRSNNRSGNNRNNQNRNNQSNQKRSDSK